MESEDIVILILKRLENKSSEALELSNIAKRLTQQINEMNEAICLFKKEIHDLKN
jgi:hypothetical protein